MTDFSGRWFTSFGPMLLTRSGNAVEGTYGRQDAPNSISGKIEGRRFVFDYVEARERGSGWFDLVRDGHFVGEYLAEGAPRPRLWDGNRGLDGIWYTSLGTMRLVQRGDSVAGQLDFGPAFEGRLANGRLEFRDLVPGPKGTAWLELAGDDLELRGEWRGEGVEEVVDIGGRRAFAEPQTAWLIVLEAHWQRSLAEREFAFGDMLDEIFARLPHVNVRHRYFHDESSLIHWCNALQFLPEPVVLVITSHGEPEGLVVNGRIIDSRKVIEALHHADSLRLLHFSSCLVAKDGGAGLANPYFPVSGYTNSVDWMASALTEFTYLDMILGKGLAPGVAAEQVYRLIGFAGDVVAPDCPYPAAGFQHIARVRPKEMPEPSAGDRPVVASMARPGVAAIEGSASFLDKLQDLTRRLTGRS